VFLTQSLRALRVLRVSQKIIFRSALKKIKVSVVTAENRKTPLTFGCNRNILQPVNLPNAQTQAAFYIIEECTKQREFGALENIPDNYPKYVVSMNDFNYQSNGIKHLNIRDFLLNDDF